MFFRKRQCPTSARRWADVGLVVLNQLWLDVSCLMGTFLFCYMFVLDLALFCALVVSASVDVGTALVSELSRCLKIYYYNYYYPDYQNIDEKLEILKSAKFQVFCLRAMYSLLYMS